MGVAQGWAGPNYAAHAQGRDHWLQVRRSMQTPVSSAGPMVICYIIEVNMCIRGTYCEWVSVYLYLEYNE